MKNHFENGAVFIGRVLIAVLFLGGAVQKANDPLPAMELLAGFGLPVVFVWPALLFNAAVGLALILGVRVKEAAFLAAAYCAATSVFHFIPADPWQMTIFVKNWSIAGGCLVLSVQGAGTWTVHGALQRRA